MVCPNEEWDEEWGQSKVPESTQTTMNKEDNQCFTPALYSDPIVPDG